MKNKILFLVITILSISACSAMDTVPMDVDTVPVELVTIVNKENTTQSFALPKKEAALLSALRSYLDVQKDNQPINIADEYYQAINLLHTKGYLSILADETITQDEQRVQQLDTQLRTEQLVPLMTLYALIEPLEIALLTNAVIAVIAQKLPEGNQYQLLEQELNGQLPQLTDIQQRKIAKKIMDSEPEAFMLKYKPVHSLAVSGLHHTNATSFSPDGTRVLVVSVLGEAQRSSFLDPARPQYLAQLFDTRTGKRLQSFRNPLSIFWAGQQGATLFVSQEPVILLNNPTIPTRRHFDVKLIDTHSPAIPLLTFFPPAQVETARLSTDGNYLFVKFITDVAQLWDVQTGEMIQEFTDTTDGKFSADGSQLLIVASEQVTVLDMATLQLLWQKKTEGISGGRWNSNGKQLFIRKDDDSGDLWNIETGNSILSLDDFLNVIFNPNGKQMASFSKVVDNKRTLLLWDTQTGNLLDTFNDIQAGTFNFDGSQLLGWASNGQNIHVAVWDTTTFKELHRFNFNKEISRFSGISSGFSPNGKQIILDVDADLYFFDSKTYQLLLKTETIHDLTTNALGKYIFSPDGNSLQILARQSTGSLDLLKFGIEDFKDFTAYWQGKLSLVQVLFILLMHNYKKQHPGIAVTLEAVAKEHPHILLEGVEQKTEDVLEAIQNTFVRPPLNPRVYILIKESIAEEPVVSKNTEVIAAPVAPIIIDDRTGE